MNSMVCVNKQSLQVKEYKGQRVVTFKEIDEVHGRPKGTASRNFKENRKHFKENVDYFLLKPSDFSMDEIRPLTIPPKGITLITESGYLMLCKSFGDKLAWDVQRQLVDTYFKKKAPAPEQMTLQPIAKKGRTYKGIPVVTLRDIFEASGINTSTLSWRLRNTKGISKGKDYWLLEGADFFAYKVENSIPKCLASCLTVISESGVRKLAKALKTEPEKLFERPALPPPTQQPKENTKSVGLMRNVPDSDLSNMETCDFLLESATALRSLADLLKLYKTSEKYRYPLRNSAWMIGIQIVNKLFSDGPIASSTAT